MILYDLREECEQVADTLIKIFSPQYDEICGITFVPVVNYLLYVLALFGAACVLGTVLALASCSTS